MNTSVSFISRQSSRERAGQKAAQTRKQNVADQNNCHKIAAQVWTALFSRCEVAPDNINFEPICRVEARLGNSIATVYSQQTAQELCLGVNAKTTKNSSAIVASLSVTWMLGSGDIAIVNIVQSGCSSSAEVSASIAESGEPQSSVAPYRVLCEGDLGFLQAAFIHLIATDKPFEFRDVMEGLAERRLAS
jgi:hypothetical protein